MLGVGWNLEELGLQVVSGTVWNMERNETV